MKNPTWPKVFAFVGLAVMSFAVALYATSVGTAGVTAAFLGRRLDGGDLLSLGSAVLVAAVGAMAAFAYLAVRGARDLTRR